jgi:hypothetical protein
VGAAAWGEPVSDPRFANRVQASLSAVTVENALRQLGQARGIPLTCGDPGLQARPFQLFARQQTLGEIMRQATTFLATPPGKCKWAPTALDGENGYRLWEDEANRRARRERLRRLAREREQRLRRDIDTAIRLASLTPEELEQVRDQYPEMATEMIGLRNPLSLLGSLDPVQRQGVLSGRRLSLPFTSLRPEQQALVRSIVGNYAERITTSSPDGTPLVLEWSADRDLPRTNLTLELAGRPDRPSLMFLIPLIPGRSAMGNPNLLYPGLTEEARKLPWVREILEQRRQESEKAGRAAETAARRDPDLQRRVTLRRLVEVPDPSDPNRTVQKVADLSAVFRQVADQTGLCILGEYDPCWDNYYGDAQSPGWEYRLTLKADLVKVRLVDALKAIQELFRVEWAKRASTILVRSPRVLFAELDGIDLLDDRLPPLRRPLGRFLRPGEGQLHPACARAPCRGNETTP